MFDFCGYVFGSVDGRGARAGGAKEERGLFQGWVGYGGGERVVVVGVAPLDEFV